MKIPVILDTDIGTDIDDTWALAMLLNCPELDPRLVLTTTGDTLYRAHLTAKFLQAAGRTEVPVGVGQKGSEAILKLQQPWLEGFDVNAYPGVIHADGLQALADVLRTAAAPVTVISIGPATNLAAALAREPGLATKGRLVGMYGSVHLGYDGRAGAAAEYNVAGDVPALRRVLAAPWLEKIITPLDTCGQVVLDGVRYQRIWRSTRPAVQALVDNYRIWAGRVPWTKAGYVETRSSVLFDTVAVYLAYSQATLEMETIRLRITDEGLTVPDSAGVEVLAALQWRDREAFYDHLVERLNP